MKTQTIENSTRFAIFLLFFSFVIFFQKNVFVFASTQTAPPPSARTEAVKKSLKNTSGKLSMFSITGNSNEKRDTVVLWSDAVIQQDETFDTIVVVWGNVEFYGKARDLVIIGGNVTLFEGAQVTGSLVVLGGKLHKKDGAQVTEQVLFELPKHLPPWIKYLGPVFSFLSSESLAFLYIMVRAVFLCLFGAIALLLMPEIMRDAEIFAQEKPLRALFYSFLGILFCIPGLVVLLLSIVGIMFIPLYMTIYFGIYVFLSYVIAANMLGHYLPPRKSVVMPPLRFFYGVFVMNLISAIPHIGTPLIVLTLWVTSGAFLAVLFTRIRARFNK